MDHQGKSQSLQSLEKVEDKKSFQEKVAECGRLMIQASVEPASLLLMTSVLMSYLTFQNVMVENICRVRLKLDHDVCKEIIKANETYKNDTEQINTILAETKIYRSILDHSFPVIYVIFMGPWSDHYGRKLSLIIPFVGYIVQSIAYLICAQFFIDSADPFTMNILTSLPRSVTGGEPAYAMAAYAYISDITTHKSRTIRSGLLSAAYTIGVPCGFSLGGLLADENVSNTASFAISIAFVTTGLLILLFRADNLTKADRLALERVEKGDRDDDTGGKNAEEEDILGPNPTWRDVLNPKNTLFKVVSLPFRKRENSGRIKFILLLVAFLCAAAPIHGEFGVIFMYVSSKLSWDASRYGYFSSVNTLIGVAGVVLSMGLFSKWMKLSDPLVGFIAGISQMAGSLVYAFICTGCGYMIYLASTIDMMNGTMIVISRSMLSKIVDDNEIGKLFSLIAILETLTPLAMDPTYSKLFHFTLKNGYFLGAFFLLSAALTVPPQIIYLWFIIKNRTSKKNPIEENCDQPSLPPNVQTSSGAEPTKKKNGIISDGGHTNLGFHTD